jgi:hypothetical protein
MRHRSDPTPPRARSSSLASAPARRPGPDPVLDPDLEGDDAEGDGHDDRVVLDSIAPLGLTFERPERWTPRIEREFGETTYAFADGFGGTLRINAFPLPPSTDHEHMFSELVAREISAGREVELPSFGAHRFLQYEEATSDGESLTVFVTVEADRLWIVSYAYDLEQLDTEYGGFAWSGSLDDIETMLASARMTPARRPVGSA